MSHYFQPQPRTAFDGWRAAWRAYIQMQDYDLRVDGVYPNPDEALAAACTVIRQLRVDLA